MGSGGRYDKSGGRRPPIRLAASTLILTPLALVIDRPWTLSSRLARAGATNLLLVTFLIPVSAILLGTLVLGEHLAARHIIGMAAIAIGLAAIDGRALRPYRVGTGFSPR